MIDSSIPKQNEVPGQMVFVNECTSAEKQHMDIDDIEETRQKTPRNFNRNSNTRRAIHQDQNQSKGSEGRSSPRNEQVF